MSGNFELLADDLGGLRVALVAGDGEILATSGPFPNVEAAIARIASVREVAGTGHVIDRTSNASLMAYSS